MKQREICLSVLEKTLSEDMYTNLLMRRELEALPKIQRPFCIELINGVLRNKTLLEYQYAPYVEKKASLRNSLLLCMALYERFFLKEKDYAVNSEYVSLGKKKHDKAFLNAVLRKCTEMRMTEGEGPEDLAIRYSLPVWLVKMILSQYPEKALEILKKSNERAEVYYRLNHKKASYEDLSKYPIRIVDEDIFTSDKNLLETAEYREGYFYVQDKGSAEITRHLDLTPDSVFLDACAAPGSKFFNALDIVKEVNAYANDVHEHRVELLKQKALELGYPDIHTSVSDARKLADIYDIRFDRILLDVPCSGLGVISRRPDIRYHIRPESIDGLVALQKEILEAVSRLLKKDGILVYSTCTINRKENERQIEAFLKAHEDFQLLEEKLIMEEAGDYFYLSKLKKV